ncbi:MAG TPA: DNA-directed RNA polymerase subunit alpha [Candidatus Saccharimonadales bacterium]|nr:DNA-directed RNA polymerase subunit alpha [Candidatus Saccharimonadales bacterium]
MSNMIHTPSIVKVDDHSDFSASFTVEPLHTGYGMTLGNSIRRVLLSSIAGAAVTSFRIDGASHEFTTVPGVKEDIVDIMLNLKDLRFKVFGEGPQTVQISKKGKGKVTGKDIKASSEVEVVNPSHVIATIDDEKASFVMDLIVEVGRGYQAIEEGSLYKPSTDMIAIDAIFTPVKRVRYKVENTRVGQITDLDRLIITIETDGSLTPRDAFEEASAILINQYSALAGQTRVEQTPLTQGDGDAESSAETDESSTLMTPIEDLNLSARTTNALVNNDIHTLRDLFSLSDSELRELKGFGNKALDEVKEKLAELEL